MKGWECPKCGQVNAPWKDRCDCGKTVVSPYIPTLPTYPSYPVYPTPPRYPAPYIGDWPPYFDYTRVTCAGGIK